MSVYKVYVFNNGEELDKLDIKRISSREFAKIPTNYFIEDFLIQSVIDLGFERGSLIKVNNEYNESNVVHFYIDDDCHMFSRGEMVLLFIPIIYSYVQDIAPRIIVERKVNEYSSDDYVISDSDNTNIRMKRHELKDLLHQIELILS